MDVGDYLIRWTIRCALLAYFVAAALEFRRPSWRGLRPLFTVSLLLYVVHVIAAFHFDHRWSHAAALEHTASETERVAGIDSGIGLYVNYLFTAVWLGDIAWRWSSPASHAKCMRKRGSLFHGTFLFIVFNASVVFETGIVRWFGVFGCLTVIVACWRGEQAHVRQEQ